MPGKLITANSNVLNVTYEGGKVTVVNESVDQEEVSITCLETSGNLTGGESFLISKADQDFYVWYAIGSSVAASLTEQGLVFTAVEEGTVGEDISIEFTANSYDGAASTTVTVVGNDIAVNLQNTAAVASTLTLQGTTYTALTPGVAGDSITVAYVDPSANDQSLDVTVVGNDITVNLATGPAGAITTTQAEITEAINLSGNASMLVEATGGDTTLATAVGATNLTGGGDASIDATTADINTAVTNSVDAAALVTVTGGDGTTATEAAAANLSGGGDTGGTDPAIADRVGLKVTVDGDASAIEVATATESVLDGIFTITRTDDLLEFDIVGDVTNAEDVDTGFTVSVDTEGVAKTPIYDDMPFADVKEILDVAINDDGDATFLVKAKKVTFTPDEYRPNIKTKGSYTTEYVEEVRTVEEFVDLS